VFIEIADVMNVGKGLQAINAQIKDALASFAAAPPTPEAARALNDLQREYEKYRELYTTVYRTVTGEVPTGLGAFFLLGAPLVAWQALVVALAVGGILYKLSGALRDAIAAWRERQANAAQAAKIAALQRGIDQATAAGDKPTADAYRVELANVLRQPSFGSQDFGTWLQQNWVYVGLGALAFVIVLRR
jgi:hypothetical protein